MNNYDCYSVFWIGLFACITISNIADAYARSQEAKYHMKPKEETED